MSSFGIAYTNKSSKTGKAIFLSLKQMGLFSSVRRVLNERNVSAASVFLRWGNSVSKTPRNSIVLNSQEAVANASLKGRMMRILKRANIPSPEVVFLEGSTDDQVNALKNREGFFFVRQKNNVTRYDNTFNRQTDIYVSKEINKTREYRVHVFNNEIMAIYEKIPNDDTVKLFKSFNCRFVRCDHTNPEIRCNAEAQRICIEAVRSMGLLFGGVDIIREKRTKKFYITEVNSSPSLNTNNLQRFVTKLVDYLRRNNAL